MRGNLDKMSIRSRKVRVPSVNKYMNVKNEEEKSILVFEPPVGHGPVEEAVHLVDVHVEVLR